MHKLAELYILRGNANARFALHSFFQLVVKKNTTCHFQIHILRNSRYSNCAIMLCQISHKHPTFFHRSSDPPLRSAWRWQRDQWSDSNSAFTSQTGQMLGRIPNGAPGRCLETFEEFHPELEGNAAVINWCSSEAAAKSILIRNGAARECSPATCALLPVYNWCVTFATQSPGLGGLCKGICQTHCRWKAHASAVVYYNSVSMYFISTGALSWSWPLSKCLHI